MSTSKDQDLLVSSIDWLNDDPGASSCADAEDGQGVVRGVPANDWGKICDRMTQGTLTPTCAIDFMYVDRKGLNLAEEDALLMRMYCFNDTPGASKSAFVPHGAPEGSHDCRLVLHVHTLMRWADRNSVSCKERVAEITSVNARYAWIPPGEGSKYRQQAKSTNIVPVSKGMQGRNWVALWRAGKGITWRPHDPSSVPSEEENAEAARKQYEAAGRFIVLGERLLVDDRWEVENKDQTENTMRGAAKRSGGGLEYEVVGMGSVEGGGGCSVEEEGKQQQAELSGVGQGLAAACYPQRSPLPAPEKPCILFVGINVASQAQMEVLKEYRGIRGELQERLGGWWRDRVYAEAEFFSTPDELVERVTSLHPTVLQISCHGEDNGLLFKDSFVHGGRLVALLAAVNRGLPEHQRIRLVIFNACDSHGVAEQLAGSVDFSVGFNGKLPDDDAVGFSRTLYQRLAVGAPLLDGFEAATLSQARGRGYKLMSQVYDPCKFVLFPQAGGGDLKGGAQAVDAKGKLGKLNLSAPTEGYVYRTPLVVKLHGWLEGASCRIAVHGLGGSGKSTLVRLFLVEAHAEGLCDFVGFLRADRLHEDYVSMGVMLSQASCKQVLLLMKPAELRDLVHSLLSSLHGRWLLAIDDAGEGSGMEGDEGMMQGFPWQEGKTIVTSRLQEWEEDFHGSGISVGGFDEEEAYEYVVSRIPGWGGKGGQVREFVQRLGCFPLAIRQAVEFSKSVRLAEPRLYLSEMDGMSERGWLEARRARWDKDMKAARNTDVYPFSFVEVVHTSVERMKLMHDTASSEGAVRLLQKISFLHPAEIQSDLFVEERVLLDLLKKQSLVSDSEASDACVSMHPLMQEVVRKHLIVDGHYDVLSSVVSALLSQVSRVDLSNAETLSMGRGCYVHVNHLIRILESEHTLMDGLANEARDAVCSLCDITARYLHVAMCLFDNAVWLWRFSMGLLEERHGTRHKDVARLLCNIGNVLLDQGKHDEALELLEESLAIRKDLLGEDSDDFATSKHLIGVVHAEQGKTQQALHELNEALAIRKRALSEGHPRVAEILTSIALVLFTKDEYDEALSLHEQTRNIYINSMGDSHPQLASCFSNIARIYSKLGKHAEALEGFAQALQFQRAVLGGEHTHVARTLNSIAGVYVEQGKHTEALEVYREALRIWRATLGGEHPDVARTVNNIATVCIKQGKHAEALEMFEDALRIRIKANGSCHSSVAETLNNIALVNRAQGKNDAALEKFHESLRIKRSVLGSQNLSVAATLNNQATVYKAQGRMAESLEAHSEALSIRRKVLGENHALIAASLNNIAAVKSAQGKYAEALEGYREALAVRKSVFGPEHLNVAASLHNIAGIEQRLGRHSEAMEGHKEALRIQRGFLNDQHPTVAESLHCIAALHMELGRFSEALSGYKEALAIRRNILDKDHTDTSATLSGTASVHATQGRYEEALELHHEALAIRENSLGASHSRVADSLSCIARIQCTQCRFGEALQGHRRALAIRQESLGDDHPDVADSLTGISDVLRRQGRLSDALEGHHRALEILTNVPFPDDHLEVVSCIDSIACVQHLMGMHTEALKGHERALSVRRSALGNHHPDVADSISGAALATSALGRHSEALELHQEALEIRSATLGGEHPETARSMYEIAVIRAEQGKHSDALVGHEEALRIRRRGLGEGRPHVDIANSVRETAEMRAASGRHLEALEGFNEALGMQVQVLEREHSDVARTLSSIDRQSRKKAFQEGLRWAAAGKLLGLLGLAIWWKGRRLGARRRVGVRAALVACSIAVVWCLTHVWRKVGWTRKQKFLTDN